MGTNRHTPESDDDFEKLIDLALSDLLGYRDTFGLKHGWKVRPHGQLGTSVPAHLAGIPRQQTTNIVLVL